LGTQHGENPESMQLFLNAVITNDSLMTYPTFVDNKSGGTLLPWLIPALNNYVPTARLGAFLDSSSMGTTMLNAGNDQKSLLAVVYDSDPGTYLDSWVSTGDTLSLKQGLAAIPNLQLSELIQQAQQFMQNYNATELTNRLLKYQRRHLSSHVLYGSSRL